MQMHAGISDKSAALQIGGQEDELRRRIGEKTAKTGYGFWIRFPEAVAGQVALGEASHFGMGGFEADGG
jgi:hypothetical protein